MYRSEWSGVCTAALAFALSLSSLAHADEEEQQRYKREAVERVADSHDFTLVLGTARLYVKQQALRSTRKLLSEWGREAGLGLGWSTDAPQFQAAEAQLMEHARALSRARIDETPWVRQTWASYTEREFGGEEADVIADHFETEGGRAQRQLFDWYMGETVLFNYTFTDRIDYTLPGAEAEMLALQRATQPRIPVEDIEFSSRYPEAFEFIARGAGLKYAKMLAIPLTGAILRYIDETTWTIERDLRARRAEVEPHLQAYRRTLHVE